MRRGLKTYYVWEHHFDEQADATEHQAYCASQAAEDAIESWEVDLDSEFPIIVNVASDQEIVQYKVEVDYDPVFYATKVEA